MNTIIRLGEKYPFFWAIVGIVLIAGIGMIDVLTGYEVSLSLFYLIPVALTSWFAGTRTGIVISIASACIWFIADTVSEHRYSHLAIPYWNTSIRFGFFLIIALLLSALKKAHEHEKELARIDNLTGAVNRHYFSELMQMEINRFQRNQHPFTVAYMDLDNFKQVNDHSGHSAGDRVLCAIVKQAKNQLRKVDVIARLGGDEFACLMPETDQAEARVAITKLRMSLLQEMHRHNWPVTFSIGVLTCIEVPQTTDELINQADHLMYSVKTSGKNSITYSVNTD